MHWSEIFLNVCAGLGLLMAGRGVHCFGKAWMRLFRTITQAGSSIKSIADTLQNASTKLNEIVGQLGGVPRSAIDAAIRKAKDYES